MLNHFEELKADRLRHVCSTVFCNQKACLDARPAVERELIKRIQFSLRRPSEGALQDLATWRIPCGSVLRYARRAASFA